MNQNEEILSENNEATENVAGSQQLKQRLEENVRYRITKLAS